MFNDKLIQFIHGDILSRIAAIDDERFASSKINESELSELSDEIEEFVCIVESGDFSRNMMPGAKSEAEMIERKFRMLCEECRYMKFGAINEGHRYGFQNWFPEYIDPKKPIATKAQPDASDADPVKINRISIGKDKSNAGVRLSMGHVVADMHFSRRELIEACPVRLIKDSVSMYSRDLREFAIEIDPENNIYGIPFGYATYYLDSMSSGKEPNARYELVPENGPGYDAMIKIYATKPINVDEPIIIQSFEDDFENTIQEHKFGREGEKEAYVEIKNFNW